jgi:hypothetical protein
VGCCSPIAAIFVDANADLVMACHTGILATRLGLAVP